MKPTRDYLVLCSFFLGPLVFLSQTLALPKAFCQDLPVNLSSLLLGHHSRTSFWTCCSQFSWPDSQLAIHFLMFWKLLGSFVLSFPSVNFSWSYRLAFNCTLVILLPLVFSFSKLDCEHLNGQKLSLLALLLTHVAKQHVRCLEKSLINNWIVRNWNTPWQKLAAPSPSTPRALHCFPSGSGKHPLLSHHPLFPPRSHWAVNGAQGTLELLPGSPYHCDSLPSCKLVCPPLLVVLAWELGLAIFWECHGKFTTVRSPPQIAVG